MDSAAMALDEVIAVTREAHGLDVSCFDRKFLRTSLEKRRVVHSEFFRDPLAFAPLEQAILPALAERVETARGFDGYLSKPVDAAQRDAILREVFHGV